MNIKNILTHLDVDSLKENEKTLQEAVTDEDILLAALDESSYEDIRQMNEAVTKTRKKLENIPGGQTADLKWLAKDISDSLAVALQSKGGQLTTTVSPAGGVNVDQLVTHTQTLMPVLVRGTDSDMVNGFNGAISKIREYKSVQDAGSERYNAKEVRSFTKNFKDELNNKINTMNLKDGFMYAYSVIFGNVGSALKAQHNFQRGDILDFHNPLYSLVLLAADGRNEESIVEDIRDEAWKETYNGQFSPMQFIANCNQNSAVSGILPAEDLLANIRPSTGVDAHGKTGYEGYISNSQEKMQIVFRIVGMSPKALKEESGRTMSSTSPSHLSIGTEENVAVDNVEKIEDF